MNSIGHKIRELRLKRNWSMEELGSKIGKSGSQISLYELGKNDMTVTLLEKVANVFNVPVVSFFDSSPAAFKDAEPLERKESFLERKLQIWKVSTMNY